MKLKIIKYLMLLIGIAPFLAYAQGGYRIKGKVGNLNKPAKAYLTMGSGASKTIDSSRIVNGAFEFKGSVKDPVGASILISHDGAWQLPAKQDRLEFYLESKDILITAEDSIKHSIIRGSPVNEDNLIYTALKDAANSKIKAIRNEYTALTAAQKREAGLVKTYQDRLKAAQQDYKEVDAKFIETHRDRYLGLYLYSIGMGYDFDPEKQAAELEKFSADLKSSLLGKTIALKIEASRKTMVGLTVKDFRQADPKGKTVKLSDFKGKYVLVDFWASWCSPCRKENPALVAAYEKFRDQNFTILGVSLDENRNDWLYAIKIDGLTWTQVSDLAGWNNAVSASFGINSIPFNILIDPSGKIIARRLTGASLDKKLSEIFSEKSPQ